jgi:lysyl-tRNA synthetase class 2
MWMKTWQKLRDNPNLLPQYLLREKVVDGIRQYFKSGGFHEVETPSLVQRPSTETFLEFFDTELNMADGQKQTGYLITSPEYAMKKLMVAGLGNIFQVCKSFRNTEGLSSRHNPEFLILEWYRVNADYTAVMEDCEKMVMHLLQLIKGPTETKLRYQGCEYDLSQPWLRMSVAEAFEKYSQIDVDTLLDEKKLLASAKQKGYQVDGTSTWEEVYNQLFLNEIEPHFVELEQPLILYDYPASQAALSRKKPSDSRFAERFEFYIAGLEIGNAFSELTDADEQEQRLRADMETRTQLGRKTYQIDEDFIDALKVGMPESAGIAVGVDRLIMLLANVPSIHDTMFFPVTDVFDLE